MYQILLRDKNIFIEFAASVGFFLFLKNTHAFSFSGDEAFKGCVLFYCFTAKRCKTSKLSNRQKS